MYAIYKGKLYKAVKKGNKYRIGSDTKEPGFTEYIDVLGNIHYDRFVKLFDPEDLDYLYEERFAVKYQGRYFDLFSHLSQRQIRKEYFVIILEGFDSATFSLAEALDFEREDKFYWTKQIKRADMEAFKILEIPKGPFSHQGIKETVLEGQAIDDYFVTVAD